MRHLIVARRQLAQLGLSLVRRKLRRIEERPAPRVARSRVNPRRTIHVKVSDQLWIVLHPAAGIARNVVAPDFEFAREEVGILVPRIPLMHLGKWQKMTIRKIERLIFLEGKTRGVRAVENAYLLHPADRVEAPLLQVGSDRFSDPAELIVLIFSLPKVRILWVAQRGGIEVIESSRKEGLTRRSQQPPASAALRERKISRGLHLCRSRRVGRRWHRCRRRHRRE